jgi:hypothetical protein
MIDPNYPATLLVRVTAAGDVEVEGRPGTVEALRGELLDLKAQGGIVQYTRDGPSSEPTDEAASTMRHVLDLVAELKLPVSFVEVASQDQVQAARAESQAQAGPWWRRLRRRS